MATKRMTPGFSDQVLSLVKALRTDAPDCVASGAVDMATGMLLAYETVDTRPRSWTCSRARPSTCSRGVRSR